MKLWWSSIAPQFDLDAIFEALEGRQRKRMRAQQLSGSSSERFGMSRPEIGRIEQRFSSWSDDDESLSEGESELRACDDIVNDWEDWLPKGFAWWQPIFDAAFAPPKKNDALQSPIPSFLFRHFPLLIRPPGLLVYLPRPPLGKRHLSTLVPCQNSSSSCASPAKGIFWTSFLWRS